MVEETETSKRYMGDSGRERRRRGREVLYYVCILSLLSSPITKRRCRFYFRVFFFSFFFTLNVNKMKWYVVERFEWGKESQVRRNAEKMWHLSVSITSWAPVDEDSIWPIWFTDTTETKPVWNLLFPTHSIIFFVRRFSSVLVRLRVTTVYVWATPIHMLFIVFWVSVIHIQ